MTDRSLPSIGVAVRIVRFMRERYTLCTHDIAKRFNFSIRHARRYVSWLQNAGYIYPKYRANKGKGKGHMVYYSVTRKDK